MSDDEMAEDVLGRVAAEQARARGIEHQARFEHERAESAVLNLDGATLALYRALKMLVVGEWGEEHRCDCGGCSWCYAERVLEHVERKPHAHGPWDHLPPCETESR